jgi:hypothetical protein
MNTEMTTTFDVGNRGPGLGQAQTCGEVKPINWMPFLPLGVYLRIVHTK